MKAETILQHVRKQGGKTALFTVKGKVLGVYGDGVDIGMSANAGGSASFALRPGGAASHRQRGGVGVDGEKQAYRCIETDSPALLYCTTNDYIFHHFAPGAEEARAQIRAIDAYIEKIAEREPERQIILHHGRPWHEQENQDRQFPDGRRKGRL